jgi:hypothetical protein
MPFYVFTGCAETRTASLLVGSAAGRLALPESPLEDDIATASFYPAHRITMGEGGAVLTDKPPLQVLIDSFRDSSLDCWCEPGVNNTCGKRNVRLSMATAVGWPLRPPMCRTALNNARKSCCRRRMSAQLTSR